MLQLNFLNQYFTKYKLGWAEFFQKSKYHYNASLHQKLDKLTSRILSKMWIGCRWWWSFSRKSCIGLSWNLRHFFFIMLCILCPNFMRIQCMFCEIFSIQIQHFMWMKMKKCVVAKLLEPIFHKIQTGLGCNFEVLFILPWCIYSPNFMKTQITF